MNPVDFQQIADFLKELGIKYAFGITGSGSSLKLITALEDRMIPFYPVGHEAAATIMAGACSRDGKTKAVAIGIKGPGFVNFLPGILSNYYEGRPALSISEAYSPVAPLCRKHKRLDHRSLSSSIIKGYATVDGTIESIRLLLQLAESEAPGPVHLDLCNESVTNDIKYLQGQLSVQNGQINNNTTQELMEVITNFQKPVIILGSLVTRQLSMVDWVALEVPVFTTAAGKGSIDENTPYSAGIVTGEIKSLSPEQIILNEADGIIGIGLRNTELVSVKSYGIPTIIIDVIDGDLHEGFDPCFKIITPDLEELVSQVNHSLEGKSWGRELVETHWLKVNQELLQEDWLPSVVFHLIHQKLSKESVLVLDTGLFCTVGETLWKATTPQEFCGSSVGRFMGVSVPTAIGVAISNPGRKVICAMGDGGIRPYLSEIKLALEEKLPILFILLSDGLYGTVALEARKNNLSRRATTIQDPTWWKTIETIGCDSRLISNLNELDAALNLWPVSKGPLFLEMRFDPAKYAAQTFELR